MKNKTISFVTCGMALALLAGALVGVSQKKIYHVGDIDENGGVIIETNVDTSHLVKRMPLVTPTDPYYTGEKKADDPLYNTKTQYAQDVSMANVGNIESTWDYYTGKGTLIAIIDSGIEHDHEEFYRDGESVIDERSAYFETNQRTENVTMKTVADNGWSVLSHDRESDGYGGYEWVDHGSNVASNAAAPMNGVGMVGIAPDANILALKIDFYDPSINAAIKYAADCGADVINLSLGAFDTDEYPDGWSDYAEAGTKTSFVEAINYAYNKGSIVVAAAGNESTDCKSYPACNTHVISVGALEPYTSYFDHEYSNYNKEGQTAPQEGLTVDLCAPGSVVGAGIKDPTKSSKALGYHFTSGTSFSSPIVAGAIALWKEKYPNGTQAELEEDLYNSCYKASDYSFRYYGAGNLDVYALLDIENEGVSLSPNKLDLDTRSEAQTITAESKEGTITSWVSSNTNVVTVSGETGSKTANATVTVVGAGEATITVTDSNGNTSKCTVTVEQYVAVTDISVVESVELYETKYTTLVASVVPSNATCKTITYKSNNTAIATVDESGKITGVAVGETTITLQAENVTKTVAVKVNELTEETIVISFKSNSGDSTKQISSSQDIIAQMEEGSEYITNASGSIIYAGSSGLKFSNSRNNGSLTLTLDNTYSVNDIIINAARYDSEKDERASITINGVTIENLEKSLKDYSLSFSGKNINQLDISSYKRTYIKSITVVAGKGTVQPATLNSISLNTSSVNKEFKVGETFSYTGLIVTAKYSDNSSKEVANYLVSNVDTSSEGKKTVTVSYIEEGITKTATYEINVTKDVAPTPEPEPDPEKPTTGTCGGSIAATSAVLSITALLGVGFIALKKRKEK